MAGSEFLTGYQAYDTDTEEGTTSYSQFDDNEEAPIFVHTGVDNPTERWHHVENLDEFFRRIYTYHQRHGFLCMVVEDFLQVVQFLFIVMFTGFLFDCINYDILFATRTPQNKQTFSEVIKIPCRCGFATPIGSIYMIVAIAFLTSQTAVAIYNAFKYWEIRQFYHIALEIDPSELDNTTWSEVQTKLMKVQQEVKMCIHKNELTQLDIYHRILRFKNFFIAMVNKSVIPLKIRLPLVGEFYYLTHGLKFNLEWILFWKPSVFNISPFRNPYYVKDEYKSVHKRIALSRQLSTNLLVLGILNLLFSPVILLWHILYFFFVYGNLMKKDPKFLGSRKWSVYGRCYSRHFNELDHELNSRLNQAYEASNEYMSGFMSPLFAIIGRFIAFVAGAVLVVILCLTWYDEDTLQIEHMITLMGVCGMLIAVGSIFIPPENSVFVPETKMTQILAHTHYQPTHWKEKAHTSKVRDEFGQIFQLKAVLLLQELLSPLITPLVLIFMVRPKALEIVDFYRNFSVDVAGVGDVCSFAQLDIQKHGHRKWSSTGPATADVYQQAEDGKTELSLMHFSLMNPSWRPPEESSRYLCRIRESAARDADLGLNAQINPLTDSLIMLSQSRRGTGVHFAPSTSSRRELSASGTYKSGNNMYSSIRSKKMVGSVSQHAGPSADEPATDGIMDALTHSGSIEGLFPSGMTSSEYNSNEMSLSVLYMHELKRRNRLATIGQIGYENLENERHVLTESELHSVPEFPSINEEFGSATTSPTLSHYSASENL